MRAVGQLDGDVADELRRRRLLGPDVDLAAGALSPAFGVLLDPLFAAAAMSPSSVPVIANALRLRRAAV